MTLNKLGLYVSCFCTSTLTFICDLLWARHCARDFPKINFWELEVESAWLACRKQGLCSSVPSTPDILIQDCNPNIWEVEAGGWELKVTLYCIESFRLPCLKVLKKKKKEKWFNLHKVSRYKNRDSWWKEEASQQVVHLVTFQSAAPMSRRHGLTLFFH